MPEEADDFSFQYPLLPKRSLLSKMNSKKKIKEWRRKEVLAEVGLDLKTTKKESFSKLKNIIKNYERKKFLGKK